MTGLRCRVVRLEIRGVSLSAGSRLCLVGSWFVTAVIDFRRLPPASKQYASQQALKIFWLQSLKHQAKYVYISFSNLCTTVTAVKIMAKLTVKIGIKRFAIRIIILSLLVLSVCVSDCLSV